MVGRLRIGAKATRVNVCFSIDRIKEIINGGKTISTPIITACLENDEDENFARRVKGRIEKTVLTDVRICKHLRFVFAREI